MSDCYALYIACHTLKSTPASIFKIIFTNSNAASKKRGRQPPGKPWVDVVATGLRAMGWDLYLLGSVRFGRVRQTNPQPANTTTFPDFLGGGGECSVV